VIYSSTPYDTAPELLKRKENVTERRRRANFGFYRSPRSFSPLKRKAPHRGAQSTTAATPSKAPPQKQETEKGDNHIEQH
jgi:hypothetical protein